MTSGPESERFCAEYGRARFEVKLVWAKGCVRDNSAFSIGIVRADELAIMTEKGRI